MDQPNPGKTVHYVEYSFPGSFFAETSSREIESRDIEAAQRNAPASAFSFRFYDVVEVSVKVNGSVVNTRSKQLNLSGNYYLGGTLYNVAEVRALGEDYDTLVSNMECNNWPVVIKCRPGNFQPFETGDTLLRIGG